jgi:hypothetical protein
MSALINGPLPQSGWSPIAAGVVNFRWMRAPDALRSLPCHNLDVEEGAITPLASDGWHPACSGPTAPLRASMGLPDRVTVAGRIQGAQRRSSTGLNPQSPAVPPEDWTRPISVHR